MTYVSAYILSLCTYVHVHVNVCIIGVKSLLEPCLTRELRISQYKLVNVNILEGYNVFITKKRIPAQEFYFGTSVVRIRSATVLVLMNQCFHFKICEHNNPGFSVL